MLKTIDLAQTITQALKKGDSICIPASESDYLSIAAEIPFKIEYHKSEIINMGLASYLHETLVVKLIIALSKIFSDEKGYRVLGSNTGVHPLKFEGGYYLPDVTVVQGKPDFKEHYNAIITNPYLIVEVLSNATKQFDLTDKLEEYKQIESLEQIIFVSQSEVHINIYRRSSNPVGWFNQDFYLKNDNVPVLDKHFLVSEIYQNVEF